MLSFDRDTGGGDQPLPAIDLVHLKAAHRRGIQHHDFSALRLGSPQYVRMLAGSSEELFEVALYL